MEIFGKTCDEFIGGCYETNSEHCLPDDEHHTTHEWDIIQNRCTECNLVSKNSTTLQSHMKKKHGF